MYVVHFVNTVGCCVDMKAVGLLLGSVSRLSVCMCVELTLDKDD